ncbi:MAG: hypothetical protein C5B49_02385 [Bdellovibrio sp.]|nr:MAG: hypothetical protein C5B49_02385 [Bdellovibrio sp.]
MGISSLIRKISQCGRAWAAKPPRVWQSRHVCLWAMLALLLVDCSNIFAPLSNKNTDDALYEDAKKAIDRKDYDTALADFAKLSPARLADRTVADDYAGALAGKCGMDFATMYDVISTTNFGGAPFFKILMNLFTGVPVAPTFCTQAEAQMKANWAINPATTGEQLFMVLLSMSKIGAYLRNKADHDGTGNLGDGSTDATFTSCGNVNDTSHLTDAEVAEVVTGFSLLLLNIGSFAGSLGLSSTVTNMNALCNLLPAGSCATTDATTVSATMITDFRDLLATTTGQSQAPVGIGTCVDPTPILLCCP